MKKLSALFVLFMICSSISFSQYQPGKNTAGVMLGVGGGGLDGDGAIPIAVEYNFHNFTPQIQAGVFGAFASSSTDGFGGKWNYTYIILAGQANYHFLPKEQCDPFVGLSLGYNIGSASWDGTGTPASVSVGGLFWSGQAGFNYWFSPKWAGQVRVGYFPYIGVGITAAI